MPVLDLCVMFQYLCDVLELPLHLILSEGAGRMVTIFQRILEEKSGNPINLRICFTVFGGFKVDEKSDTLVLLGAIPSLEIVLPR